MSGLLACAACAPLTRVRRALAPPTYVSPAGPTRTLAAVSLSDTSAPDDPPRPFAAEPVIVRDGESWIEPLPITDRQIIEVRPLHPETAVRIYVRHTGLIRNDFEPVVSRSGTLRRALPTAVRFLPDGPIGSEPFELHVRDLQNIYNEERLEDGDLLMIEVSAPSAPTERYLFRSLDFGLRTRLGASLLLRMPIPWIPEQSDVGLSPALTGTLALNYRVRSERPGLSFAGEQLALLLSVGVGSTVLDEVDGKIDQQLKGAFNAALAGGGIEAFQFVGIQILGNASAPFRDDLEAGWTLAAGIDAVRLTRFADNLVTRLLFEHPQHEERRWRHKDR